MTTSRLPSVLLACLTLCVIACGRAESPEQPRWTGMWEYSAELGSSAGGSPMTMEYVLTVPSDPPTPDATLRIRGFQTDETLRCDASIIDGRLVMTFHSYGNGKTVNRYGVAQYSPGQRLLTLFRDAKGTVTTVWEALDPPVETQPRQGTYFRPRLTAEAQGTALLG